MRRVTPASADAMRRSRFVEHFVVGIRLADGRMIL
jgi:hypothetical protein